MTIHSEHPFLPGDDAKDALRRLRGRLVSPVTVVASEADRGPKGLTVSSVLLVDGDPAQIVVCVDPDSDLGELLEPGTRAAVSLLEASDSYLAEAFAGLAPAPGGPFTLGRWESSAWGPHLSGRSWCGVVVTDVRPLGWSHEVTGTVEHVEILGDGGLAHARGRFGVLG